MLKIVGEEFKIAKREIRVWLYNYKLNKFIANSACVRANWNPSSQDKWTFNSWSVVGQNPLIFTSKDENFVNDDDWAIIFEFVLLWKLGDNFKDISWGFSTLSMKEFKNKSK